MICSIKTRTPELPNADDQRKRVRWILSLIDSSKGEPSAAQVRETTEWLQSIRSHIPDHNQFVASSFQLFYPAWEELFKGVKRKSAKTVLGWIRRGYKPKFAGTAGAKPAKREIVVAMLRKVVAPERIPEFLSGRFPHRVAFANHQSLFKKWEFSSDQTAKLVEYGAAGIWTEKEDPVVINPMGVADSAGKDRLICNMKYVNLFLKALPFKYERLRDLLAFTKQGSYLATWDLKSGSFHVPIHPEFRKYFCFRIGGVTFHFKVLCFGFPQACFVFTKSDARARFRASEEGNTYL
jgi:hypothetical protein